MARKKIADKSPWWLAGAAALGAIGGAAVTGGFNYLSHQNDLDAKMIELGVGILRAEPTPESTPLREWAIDVIDKRAQFSFNAAQRATLLKKELPFKGGWVSLGLGGLGGMFQPGANTMLPGITMQPGNIVAPGNNGLKKPPP